MSVRCILIIRDNLNSWVFFTTAKIEPVLFFTFVSEVPLISSLPAQISRNGASNTCYAHQWHPCPEPDRVNNQLFEVIMTRGTEWVTWTVMYYPVFLPKYLPKPIVYVTRRIQNGINRLRKRLPVELRTDLAYFHKKCQEFVNSQSSNGLLPKSEEFQEFPQLGQRYIRLNHLTKPHNRNTLKSVAICEHIRFNGRWTLE